MVKRATRQTVSADLGASTRARSAAESRKLDQNTIERYGIPAFVLMDHAGKAVADAARALCRHGKQIVAICGSGHNGADGVVAARWLKGWGFDASVLCIKDPTEWRGSAALHLSIARRFRVPIARLTPRSLARIKQGTVLIDALLGTGTAGPIRPLYAGIISQLNALRCPVVSIDLPSGMNADSGDGNPVVRAAVTVTMGAPKKGLLSQKARPALGDLRVVDIGIPFFGR